MNFNHQKKPYLYIMVSLLVAAVLALLFFFLLYRYQGLFSMLQTLGNILSPFVFGGVLAYLLKPCVNFFDRVFMKILPKKAHHTITGLSILTTFISVGVCIYTLFALMLPEFYESVLNVFYAAPDAINELVIKLRKLFEDYPTALEYINEAYARISETLRNFSPTSVMPHISTFLGNISLGVVAIFDTVLDIFVGLCVTVYLLMIRHKFGKQAVLVVHGIFRKPWANFILQEVSYADKMFGGFINGKLLDSAIIGILCYFVCLIVGFPNPTLISMIIGFTNIIPFFGPFVGAVPASIFILLTDPTKTIWFVMFIVILQQFDGNILGPKILGDCTGLSSFWVLFSIIFFGGLWGFAGMIIGVPLFAVLYDIFRKIITNGLNRHGCQELLASYHQEFHDSEPSVVEQVLDTIEDAVDEVLEVEEEPNSHS